MSTLPACPAFDAPSSLSSAPASAPQPPSAHAPDDLPALALAGSAWAQAELGDQLLYGRGRPAHQPSGVSWLCKAALAGSLRAMLGLSQWYLSKTPGYSLVQGRFWLARALSTGSALALERAGDAVLALNLDPGAVEEAARLYKAGAPSCPNCLAKLLDLRVKGLLGTLSLRDRRACMDRLEQLARAGSLHALRAMGEDCLAHRMRRGMRRACIAWLSAAARRGERTCQRELALLLAGSKTGRHAMAAPWRWMELAAEDDPEAQYQAGVWLAAGRGRKADPRRAEHFLRLASAFLPKALVQLGILLVRDADEARRDEGRAALARAAALGMAEANFELGCLALEQGEKEQAAARFQQAGSHGPSLRRLARMALDDAQGADAGAPVQPGGGPCPDEGQAWQLMAQAAGLGDAEAMLHLARRKLAQAEQAKDGEALALCSEACGLLQGACLQDHPQALHELALLAASGRPGAPGKDCAMKLHARAARLGHPGSMECQADDLLAQARQACKDRQGPATKGHGLLRGRKAARLLSRAAGLGSTASACKYGALLEEGTFVRQNWLLAGSCYRKAASAGDREGHWRLGLLLLKIGGPCDAQGLREIAEAAALGHRDARTETVRRCLACGKPRPARPWLARHLHELADQGSPEGMRLLSEALDRDWLKVRRSGEGHAMLAKAAGKGDVPALIRLGDKHAKGIGIDQNRDRARLYYAMAEKLGSQEAGERLRNLPGPDGAEPWMAEKKKGSGK